MKFQVNSPPDVIRRFNISETCGGRQTEIHHHVRAKPVAIRKSILIFQSVFRLSFCTCPPAELASSPLIREPWDSRTACRLAKVVISFYLAVPVAVGAKITAAPRGRKPCFMQDTSQKKGGHLRRGLESVKKICTDRFYFCTLTEIR